MLCTSLILASVLATQPKLILAHYMPWFAAKPVSMEWGWHWTMGKMDPDHIENGKRQIASHYYPLIGPYDSGDPAVIDCQVQQMKIAGIDGVLIDWYGNRDTYDYALVHRNTERFVKALRKAKMKFALVYEDRSVDSLIKTGKIKPEEATKVGNETMQWVQDHWFSLSNYVQIDGRPLLLVFGPEYYKGDAWNGVFANLKKRPYFLTLDSQQGPADGAYGWPQPSLGMKALDSYYLRSAGLPLSIPPAFPRFHDYYQDAGVHQSWGKIEDGVFEATFEKAIKSPIVQLVTWNDWGEGTVIEPSREFGYRDLETTQRMRHRYVDKSFPFQPADLRLPIKLLELRRKGADPKRCDKVSELLLQGRTKAARALIQNLG